MDPTVSRPHGRGTRVYRSRMSTPPYDPSQQYPQPDEHNEPPWSREPYPAANPYGTPGYQQPMYTHPYPAYPVSGSVGATNVMAILALVFAFVLAPLGIIFGHVALSQLRTRGGEGHGLALAGVVLGYMFVAIWIIMLVMAGCTTQAFSD